MENTKKRLQEYSFDNYKLILNFETFEDADNMLRNIREIL
jgi:hypothetical protein